MRIPKKLTTLMMLVAAMTACGVPREAGDVAAAGAMAAPIGDDDDSVRQALTGEADAWTHLAAVLLDSEFGGIQGVDPKFTALVIQTAALARRQRDLIAQGLDDPVQNRQTLEKLRTLWGSANQYLNP